MSSMNNKTRFAPSPTGLMHVGNCRTALFNVLLAKKMQGAFVLRIEDTDRVRSERCYVDALIEDLTWLGVEWEEGPGRLIEQSYFQSERLDIYQTYYQQLIEKGLVYPCFCSEEKLKITRKLQLAAGEPPRYPGTCAHLSKVEVDAKYDQGVHPTLRFRVPKDQAVEFFDLVRGQQCFSTNDLGDFIIKKTDGSSAFMYCNAIDDALMGVTHVLRGEDHLTNTPRQILILQALGLPIAQYGHISIILGDDGKPLSKRNGSMSVKDLRDEGFIAQALVNYLARLGHNYADNHYADLDGLAAVFSIESLVKSPAKFDKNQLLYWQKEAVMAASDEQLFTWLQSTLQPIVPKEKQLDFIQAMKANIVLPEDAKFWASVIFSDDLVMDEQANDVLVNSSESFFQVCCEAVELYNDDWPSFVAYVKDKTTIKGKQLFQPIRVGLTGQLHGPEMLHLLPLINQEKMLERFARAKIYARGE